MAQNKLPETTVRTAKPRDKAYRLTDGGGLYLLINPDGSKYWRLDYTFKQKRKTLSLGTYPNTTFGKSPNKSGAIFYKKLSSCQEKIYSATDY